MRFWVRSLGLMTTVAILSLTTLSSDLRPFKGQITLAQPIKVDSRKVEADRLVDKGRQQLQNQLQASQSKTVLPSLERALEIYRDIGDRRGEATALFLLGTIYFDLKQYPQMQKVLQQSLTLSRVAGDKLQEAKVLQNLGALYNQIEQYPKAIEFHQQAIALHQHLDERQRHARTLQNLGFSYRKLQRPREAIQVLQQALKLYPSGKTPQDMQVAFILLDFGDVYLEDFKQYPKALEFYQQALKIYREQNFTTKVEETQRQRGEIYTLLMLGNTQRELGQYQKSLDTLKEASKLAKVIQDTARLQVIQNSIVRTYSAFGQDKPFVDQLRERFARERKEVQAKQGPRRSSLNSEQTRMRLTIDSAFASRKGKYDEALQFLQQRLMLSQKEGKVRDQIEDWKGIGDFYQEYGRPLLAINSYLEALKLSRKLGDRGECSEFCVKGKKVSQQSDLEIE
jgi:tetratricopeptide (TPR) repeat protein